MILDGANGPVVKLDNKSKKMWLEKQGKVRGVVEGLAWRRKLAYIFY
jgi:hypothetical protein